MLHARQRLGDFEIIRLLGKGGMGEVYEALQSHPERRVALKVLSPWLAENDDALERFWREAQVPAQLDHPGVVRIIATGKADGIAYYAMQLVRGVSLAELMCHARGPQPATASYPEPATNEAQKPTLPFGSPVATSDTPELPPVVEEYLVRRYNTVARIGVQAARALASAHRQGYLHRDIKPSNLMVDHHNHVYLLDFGLTRALDSGMASRAGVVVGTPWYMSPEQARGLPLDARSDIFSLGVTLYELATRGHGPYTARRDDSTSVLLQVRSGVMRSLRELAPDISPGLETVLQRAIGMDPERRYQTAEEMAHDLEQCLAQNSVPTAADRMAPPVRKKQLAIILGAIVLAVAIVIVGVNWIRGLGNTPPGGSISNVKPTDSDLATLFRRERIMRTRLALLREDGQPALHRVVLGDGKFTALPTELRVISPAGERPTLLALDFPDSPAFEFAVEIKPWPQLNPIENELGIFWGWRDKSQEPLERKRFLAASLDTRAALKDVDGRLYIGSWMFLDTKDGQAGMNEQSLRPLNQGQGWIPLAAPAVGFDGWHKVRVRVAGQKCTVTIDKQPPREFDVPWMIRVDPWLKTYAVSAQGAVGVWVQNGIGLFRNATIMALPGNAE